VSPSKAKPDPKATADRLKQYFAALPPDTRRVMKSLRAAIKAAAPGAVEVVSYGIPAFKLEGRMLVWYAAWKAHTSLYPMKGIAGRVPAAVLKGHVITKGTIRFPLDRTLPVSLVKRLVKARALEVALAGKR
jgi:uncharacterized protein YdhG (YjbR/CyaY superfamily)